MIKKLKQITMPKFSLKKIQKNINEMKDNKDKTTGFFNRIYDIANEKEKSMLLNIIDRNNLPQIKEILLLNPDLHKRFIKKYFPEYHYIENLDDFEENYFVIHMPENIKEELDSKNAFIVRAKKEEGKIFLLLFLPFFGFFNNLEFDNIGFVSPEIANFYFKQTIALENMETGISFKELLFYIEEKGINDFHIRGLDENRYTFTGRIGQEVVKIGGVKPANIIDDLILQSKIMMNKDTSTIKPEDTGFAKITVINSGNVIERSFRINTVMSNKIHSQVYSMSIRRLMTIQEIESLGLEGLGYTPQAIEMIKKIQFRKYGISVVSGKTNSGKTTLLACILNELYKYKHNQEKRIISIENPVEIVTEYDQIDLSVTENADKDKRMTIDRAIKSILRHDPDVVLISEVRTDDDVKNYLKLALTGTNTFTTIHAGDVKTTILRLLKGADSPLDVISNLNGIIAQTLVSKICKKCHGTGILNNNPCPHCSGTGKKGMVPVYEIAYFKKISPAKFINDDNEINFKALFDFQKLINEGDIEYISKTQVAKHLLEKGEISVEDFKAIKESEEELNIEEEFKNV